MDEHTAGEYATNESRYMAGLFAVPTPAGTKVTTPTSPPSLSPLLFALLIFYSVRSLTQHQLTMLLYNLGDSSTNGSD